jgi:long-chain acyl-CoA synthetase
VLITSESRLAVAREALLQCPRVRLCLVVGGGEAAAGAAGATQLQDFDAAVAAFPKHKIADEWLGASMLYSSGTTGRPKGILRPLPENPPDQPLPLFSFVNQLWHGEEGMVYLSPAPLYHSAPLGNVGVAMRKLPAEERTRHDLSSLKIAIHAAAPCPVPVKEQMIDWWGPIIHEYYGATEGLGFTACNSAEWLAHRGSVGRVLLGDLQILDEQGQPVPQGTGGEVWFKTASPFVYFNDPERTALTRSADGTMSTVGDMGYLDQDGFLYLTDRSSFMIISGGVNIYPQECENLLVTHPKVADAAVFGVPNEDFGEEVKAVVEMVAGVQAGPELAQELMVFCAQHLARHKCPRTVDFTDRLPRLPTGKLYKRSLRDPYWASHKSRIV